MEEDPHKLRALIFDLVDALTTYNQKDMLDGYLNALGGLFNKRLTDMGLRGIEAPMSWNYNTRELLKSIIIAINGMNAHDALDGALNELCEFNDQLEELDLPTFSEVPDDDDDEEQPEV